VKGSLGAACESRIPQTKGEHLCRGRALNGGETFISECAFAQLRASDTVCAEQLNTIDTLQLWRFQMPQSKQGRSQDRAKVAGGQKHEVAYEAGKTGASPRQVRQAVKDAGNSRKKVEDKLANK